MHAFNTSFEQSAKLFMRTCVRIDSVMTGDLADQKLLEFVKKSIRLTKEKTVKPFVTLPDNLTIDQVIDRVVCWIRSNKD